VSAEAAAGKPRVTNDDFAKQVADGLIAQLKAGVAPWQQPWVPGSRFMPYNALTGRDYRGGNAVWLLARAQTEGFSGARWCTYRQAEDLGAQVRRGVKGTKIQYFKRVDEKGKTEGKGEEIVAEGDLTSKHRRVKVFTATVFHEAQIDGLPPPAVRPTLPAWERLGKVEALVAASRADVRHVDSSEAFYVEAHDYIQMPLRSQFPSADTWSETILHELGHWTGHSTRLARPIGGPRGTPEYAREELRAEIASLMLGDELGVGHDPKRHAQYVGHWIKKLQEDPREIFRASSDAQKIVAYINGLAKDLAVDAEAPAKRPPLSLPEAKAWDRWHDAAITAVVFVEGEGDVAGHQAAHPNPGARYVVLGDGGAIPDVAALPQPDRRKTPVLEVLEAIQSGRNRPGETALTPVAFQVAMSHTKDGHALGKKVRGALEEVGLGGLVVMPYSIGKRWADEGRERVAGQALAR
jgi:antirestriction protein ArdC